MNLLMGEFVVMPNHFHAVIIIGQNSYNLGESQPKNQFGPQSKNLASIIRGFKSAVTIGARKIDAPFVWQPRYHDHIIRNSTSFKNISTYIKNNPKNWKNEKFHCL